MKVNEIAKPNSLAQDPGIDLLTYKTAVEMAFSKIEQHTVLSSWKDSFSYSNASQEWMDRIEIPTYGSYKDQKWHELGKDSEHVLKNV